MTLLRFEFRENGERSSEKRPSIDSDRFGFLHLSYGPTHPHYTCQASKQGRDSSRFIPVQLQADDVVLNILSIVETTVY